MEANGTSKEEYEQGFRDQTEFISKRLQQTIEGILKNSSKPPVIILQSDHGPGSQYDQEKFSEHFFHERFFILNAYHLPGGKGSNLYATITPVNTFRIVFNEYFGTSFELLPDEQYFAPASRIYQFSKVGASLSPSRQTILSHSSLPQR